MHQTRKKFLLVLLAGFLVAGLLAATSRAQANPALTTGASVQKVRIAFAAKVGDKAFSCADIYQGVGLAKSTIRGRDLRFFISGVELIASDGTAVPVQLEQDGQWQYKNVALLDFEDGTGSCSNGNAGMHKEVAGTVPPGSYSGLRFTLGVPFELDHIDASTAPSPLNTTAMFWVWQSGYKFLRAEVALASPPAAIAAVSAAQSAVPGAAGAPPKPKPTGFVMHLGSTGCAAASVTSTVTTECPNPNRPPIQFKEFEASKDTVVFDLAKLLRGVDLSGASATVGVSCMSSPKTDACVTPMQALGISFRDSAPIEQTVFSREAHE